MDSKNDLAESIRETLHKVEVAQNELYSRYREQELFLLQRQEILERMLDEVEDSLSGLEDESLTS